MKKNILIIDGHPYDKSFCRAISHAYQSSAQDSGHVVQVLTLIDLKFDPILRMGYAAIQALEPDLEKAQQLIKWANHVVVITPIWWGGPTALLKGFLDRTMLPGFAFKYRKNSAWWDQYLTGRTAHVIVTSDAPSWWMRFIRGDSTVNLLVGATLSFVGIKTKNVLRLGNIKNLNEAGREKLLDQVRKIAKK